MWKGLSIVLVLAGCAAPPVGDVRAVRWVKVADADAACRAVPGARMQFFKIRGCATWESGACTIYASDITSERDLQRLASLGHELKHCFDGSWHDAYGHMRPNVAAR